MGQAAVRRALLSVAPHLLLTSLTLAAVATLQSLLAFRLAQTLADLPPRPPRDLIAQGAGNCASALVGGIVALATPVNLAVCFQTGGRARISPIPSALLILLAGLLLSPVLAAIPAAVLFAILVAIGIALF